MPNQQSRLLELLIDLETEMRNHGFWQVEHPSAVSLLSTQPFCVDTLTFPQWVQFVFIPKLRTLGEQNLPLPPKCETAPMAEEYFRGTGDTGRWLVLELKKIDEHISG